MTAELVTALPASLTYLDWDLGDQAIVQSHIIVSLLRLPNLHHLSLRFRQHNGLAYDFLHLMGTIPSSIRALDLRNNRLDCHDMEILCQSICKSSIITLNLGLNNIGDHGATVIATILLDSACKLEHLDLNCNIIGNDGASSLARSLKTNKAMKRLKISGNLIQNAGPFCVALESNTTLLILNTEATDVEHAFIESLLGRNRAGRRMLQECSLQVSMWPLVLGRISNQVDHLFFFCQEKPDLFMKV